MSSGFPTERRHSVRVAVPEQIDCRLDLRTRVRLLDISLNGALLATELPVPTGTPAQLRSALGANAFRTEVQVRRSQSLAVGVPMNGVGTMFTTMDERSRRSLEDFLRKASE
jgi:c-di-GMP-binding flagellar brake protein YcgR